MRQESKRAIISRCVTAVVLLAVGLLLAVQLPWVQTRLAATVLERLNRSFDGKVSVGQAKIQTNGTILLKDILVIDSHPYDDSALHTGRPRIDTLAYIKTVSATVRLSSLLEKEGIKLGRATIEDGLFYLTTEPGRSGNLQRIFGIKHPEVRKEPKDEPAIFSIGKVRIRNFRFRLVNFAHMHPYRGHGIDFENLDAKIIELEGRRLRMDGIVISGICDHAEIVEKSGYHLRHLSGSTRAGMRKVLVDDVNIVDEWSDIRLSYFNMLFDRPEAFMKYVDEVRMVAKFNPSTVAMKTISYFGAHTFKENPIVLQLESGKYDGPVKDFFVKNLTFNDLDSGVSGIIDGRYYGIPSTLGMGLDVRISDLKFNTKQLSQFISSWSGHNVDFSKIAPGRQFILNADASDLLDKLKVDGVLSSAMGNLDLKCSFEALLDTAAPIGIDAILDTKSLQMGKLLGIKKLGETDFKAKAQATLAKDDTNIKLDSLIIRGAEYSGYRYSEINIGAEMLGGRLFAAVDSKDENLKLTLGAVAETKEFDGASRYRLISKIEKANLSAMNLVPGVEKAEMGFGIHAELKRNTNGIFEGGFVINDISFEDASRKRELGDINLEAIKDGEKQKYILDSDVANAEYISDAQPWKLVADLKRMSTARHFPSIHAKALSDGPVHDYSFKLETEMLNEVLSILKPGFYIEKGSVLDFNAQGGQMDIRLHSGRFALGPNYLKDVTLGADNAGDRLTATFKAAEIRAGDMRFQNPAFTAHAHSDSLDLNLIFNDENNINRIADLSLTGRGSRNDKGKFVLDAACKESYLNNAGTRWELSPSTFKLEGKDISIRNFSIFNDAQRLSIDGNYRPGSNDTLKVEISHLQLSNLDNMFDKPYGVKGDISGKARIVTRDNSGTAILMNIVADSLAVGDTKAGNLRMGSYWDSERNRISLMLQNTLGNRKAIQMRGYYVPETKNIHAETKIDSLALAIAYPFLRDVLTEAGGSLSGDLQIDGRLDSLSMSSQDVRLNDVLIRLAYTGVPYTISGPVELRKEGVYFDNLSIFDDEKGHGQLSGYLHHRNLKDIHLDAGMNFSDMKIIDTPDLGNSSFYGKLSASGNARVKGPFNALEIEADASTDGDGEIHVPLSGSLSSSSGKLLTFTEHNDSSDPYEDILREYLRKKKKSVGSDLHLRGHVNIGRGLKAFMEIDKAFGNIISFNGDGQVNLELRPSKSIFNINGDYNISEGKYHFVLPGIMEKDLNIAEGSSVAFGGDLMDTRINLNTNYKLRAMLSTLLPDDTRSGVRRSVECGIKITERLRKPKVDFYINIPDLDPTLKSEVDAALHSEDKIQKQFVALLLMGSFLPSEESGVFNGTNMLYSNLTEVVSSQMSNIMKKLNIPLDFGFRYQENNTGNNVFDVALSTQLFNNRVIVSGSVGNRQYKTSGQGTGDVIGDVDIQIKLDKSGQYRATVFSHSADESTNFLDLAQRNGIGLSFQKDFKAKKKNKSQENIIIKIKNEQGETIPDTRSARRKRSRRSTSKVRTGDSMQP